MGYFRKINFIGIERKYTNLPNTIRTSKATKILQWDKLWAVI